MTDQSSPTSPARFDDEVINRRVAALVQLRNTMPSMEDIASALAKSPRQQAEVLEAQAQYEAYANETEFLRASRNARVGHEATQPARNGFTTRPPVAE